MSKYNLSDLITEITGTGRIGTYIDTYRGLVNKIDDLKEKGITVKELGMSGDGKTAFEFEVYPGDKDEAFSVYPYKFDPRDEDEMEIFRFSIGGKPVAIRAAKELLGQGAYSNKEIRDGLDQLDDAGDDTSDFSDLREDEEVNEVKMANVNVDEVKFHLDAYEDGTIDGDDLHKAISEIFFGEVVAPGTRNPSVEFTPGERIGEEDSIEEASANPEVDELLSNIERHLKSSEKNFQDGEIKAYLASLKRDIDRGEFDGVESISLEDHEEDLANYIADRALQEHFGRFMKDYQ